MAVFYPHKFYVGRIVRIEPAGELEIRFLEQRPNQRFKYHSDCEMVDRKWIFYREAKVELQGKELFRIEDLELIRKKYEEEKKKYLLKEKVSYASSFIPNQCQHF